MLANHPIITSSALQSRARILFDLTTSQVTFSIYNIYALCNERSGVISQFYATVTNKTTMKGGSENNFDKRKRLYVLVEALGSHDLAVARVSRGFGHCLRSIAEFTALNPA